MTLVFYSYISKSLHPRLLNYLSFFSKEFQSKIMKYKKWEDAQLSLLGRLLLKEGLENYYGCLYDDTEIDYMTHSKPYFKSKKIHFNISHSGNIAICAISKEYDVGIDIEIIKDVEIEYFKSHMTDFEWNKVIASGDLKIDAFYKYWTQKESVIKANSKGLYIPLKSFEVKNNRTRIGNERYVIEELKIDDNYKCSLAFKENNLLCPNNRDKVKLFCLEL